MTMSAKELKKAKRRYELICRWGNQVLREPGMLSISCSFAGLI
jgi:hypothetical protein